MLSFTECVFQVQFCQMFRLATCMNLDNRELLGLEMYALIAVRAIAVFSPPAMPSAIRMGLVKEFSLLVRFLRAFFTLRPNPAWRALASIRLFRPFLRKQLRNLRQELTIQRYRCTRSTVLTRVVLTNTKADWHNLRHVRDGGMSRCREALGKQCLLR